jgi:uncharacterized membrane protein
MDKIVGQTFDQLLVKVYDKDVPQDWSYDADPGHLNPKREVDWSKPVVEQVMERLQKITDDIVRRQIQPRPEPDKVKTTMMPEGMPVGVPLPMLQAIANSGGSSPIFQVDEMIQDLIPYLPPPYIDELMLPPEIDCDEILGAIGLTQAQIDANRDDNRSTNPDLTGGASSDASNDEDDGSGEDESGEDEAEEEMEPEEESEEAEEQSEAEREEEFERQFEDTDYDETYANCAGIELGWLKILLVIAKVIGMLKRIISMILAILIPIIEIIQLAAGAWLNPTNIAKIIQFIIQMVIALIVMIISMIIQLIWDLLNLDCIIDSVKATIDEIKKALSAFASITNQFNPTAVGLMLDKVKVSLLDPLESAAESFKENAEAWRNAFEETKELFSSPEARAKMMKEMEDQLVSGVVQGVKKDPNLNKAAGLAADVKGTVGVGMAKDESGQMKFTFTEDSALGKAMKSVKNLSDWKKKDNATNQSASSMAESLSRSAQFVGLAMTPKQKTDDTSKAANKARKK